MQRKGLNWSSPPSPFPWRMGNPGEEGEERLWQAEGMDTRGTWPTESPIQGDHMGSQRLKWEVRGLSLHRSAPGPL